MGGGRPNTTGNSSQSSPKYIGGMGCTSIVARNKSGNVFQGRNLDWDAPDDLRNLSVLVSETHVHVSLASDLITHLEKQRCMYASFGVAQGIYQVLRLLSFSYCRQTL